ncbi:MAG: arsenic resistance N-acetyltransferase ArsN2, partial [Chitinophagaceae bacterium]
MITELSYRIGNEEDLAGIIDLLEKSELPISDIMPGKIDFLVAVSKENAIVGCVGIEQYGKDGLLRSFVVDKNFRDKKIGSHLFTRLLSIAHQSGIHTLHLLTTTAEKYFSKKGFVATDRETAAAAIKATTEFSSLCPSSSAYMVLADIGKQARYYYSNEQALRLDKETGSSFWSINGENLQFTLFEVPPNTHFSVHKHDSEQITYVLEGELFFEIEKDISKLSAGDSIV